MSSFEMMGKKSSYKYQLVLEDLDLFFNRITTLLHINPQLTHLLVERDGKLEEYLKNNLHPLFDPTEPVPNNIAIFVTKSPKMQKKPIKSA